MGTSPSRCNEEPKLPPQSNTYTHVPPPAVPPPNYNQVVWNDFRNLMSEYDNLTQQSELQINKEKYVRQNYDKISLCELQKHVVFLNSEIDKLKSQRENIKRKTLDKEHTKLIMNNIVEFIDNSWMYNPITSSDSREDDDDVKLKNAVTLGIEAAKNSILDELNTFISKLT